MNNINYVFFEEFKKLEKLCCEMYNSHNGITHYIDDMKSTSYNNYRSIPDWETDLSQLKRLRHIRNTLAHEEGSFNQNICTPNDIEWVRTFYKRILTQSDPLGMQYRNSKTPTNATTPIPKNNEISEPESLQEETSLLTTISIFTIVVILIVLIVLMWYKIMKASL